MTTALLKFTQGATVGDNGEALMVTTGGGNVAIANAVPGGIGSWEIDVLEVPYGSATTLGMLAMANGPTPAASLPPDVGGGCWRIRLRVWSGANRTGTLDTDIRNIGCLGANGKLAPPPQVWPEPLPDPRSNRAGAKPNEMNFDGQDDGWAGGGNDGLLRHVLRTVGAEGDVVGPAGAVNLRIAVYDGTTGKLLKDGGSTIADLQKIPVVIVSTNTLTWVRATHAGKYLRFTHASGCVITINDGVGEAGDWSILRATQAAALSFSGSATVVPPASKAPTSAEAGATLGLFWDTTDTVDLSGELSDA